MFPRLLQGIYIVGYFALLCFASVLAGCGGDPASPPEQRSNSEPVQPTVQLVPVTNMVEIRSGSFVRLKQAVTLTRNFWIGKFEVTQGEYSELMGNNPSHFKAGPSHPVEKVSYFDAMAYCAALTKRERQARRLPSRFEYRLPTEAEWEYACRAGTTNAFSFGDFIGEADGYAWTAENSEASTHTVGLKRPNPWGLHDMHGNVWEWCLDWFAEYPAGPVVDPTGPSSGKHKVFRGGGWNNEIEFARSSNRFMMAPGSGIYFVGFRVVLAPVR